VGLVQNAPEWVVSPVLTLFSGRHFMHVRRALALTITVPVLLAGCSDDPEPTPKLPEPTSSSPSPTEPASEEPEAESPEEFIRRWQAASDRAQTSGSTESYRALTKGCDPCDGFADRVDEIYNGGGRIVFSGSEVLSVRDDGPDSDAQTVRIRSGAATIYESGDSQAQRLDGGELRLHVFLRKVGASWVVGHYTILPS
jgi:hypothetical protein